MPGNAVGIYRMVPSLSGGMNSDPSFPYNGTELPAATMASITTSQRRRNAPDTKGRYSQINIRLMGFLSSGAILPLISHTMRRGARLIDTRAANNIAALLV